MSNEESHGSGDVTVGPGVTTDPSAPGGKNSEYEDLLRSFRELEKKCRILEGRLEERTADLADVELRLKSIVDTIPDGTVTIDEKAIIRSFSSASERLFGYGASEVIGENVKILMPSPYHDRHDGYIARYLETGEKRIMGSGRIVFGRRRDGTTFPMELHVAEMFLGGRRAFLGAIRDITRRDEAEGRVQDLQSNLLEVSRNSILGEMSSALAHELNQPLSAIISYLDAGRHLIAAAGVELPERELETLEKASGQAQRAGNVIQQMRQLIRYGETDRQVSDINTIVQDSMALVSVGLASGESRIALDLGIDLPPVLVDTVQMQQVVLNLIRNSVEALGGTDGGRTIVRTEPAGAEFVRLISQRQWPRPRPRGRRTGVSALRHVEGGRHRDRPGDLQVDRRKPSRPDRGRKQRGRRRYLLVHHARGAHGGRRAMTDAKTVFIVDDDEAIRDSLEILLMSRALSTAAEIWARAAA